MTSIEGDRWGLLFFLYDADGVIATLKVWGFPFNLVGKGFFVGMVGEATDSRVLSERSSCSRGRLVG